MTPDSTLDREFLEIRALILQLAAAIDRLDRCPRSNKDDPRRQLLESAIPLVIASPENRAEKIQLHFGNEYNSDWRSVMQLKKTE